MNIFNSWIRLKQTDQNILKIQGYESNLFMLCNFLNGMNIEARVACNPSPEKNKALFKDIIHF